MFFKWPQWLKRPKSNLSINALHVHIHVTFHSSLWKICVVLMKSHRIRFIYWIKSHNFTQQFKNFHCPHLISAEHHATHQQQTQQSTQWTEDWWVFANATVAKFTEDNRNKLQNQQVSINNSKYLNLARQRSFLIFKKMKNTITWRRDIKFTRQHHRLKEPISQRLSRHIRAILMIKSLFDNKTTN